jgi:hypothetical protein
VDERRSGLAGVRAAWRRVAGISLPARYPIVQFPNPPLIVSLGAGVVGAWCSGEAARTANAVATVALVAWAYEELAHGVNLFRRALGLTFLVIAIGGLAARMRR